jgi:hypothetical protein
VKSIMARTFAPAPCPTCKQPLDRDIVELMIIGCYAASRPLRGTVRCHRCGDVTYDLHPRAVPMVLVPCGERGPHPSWVVKLFTTIHRFGGESFDRRRIGRRVRQYRRQWRRSFAVEMIGP